MGAQSKPGDLVQGTLDMLVLKTVARGAMHGYAIAGSEPRTMLLAWKTAMFVWISCTFDKRPHCTYNVNVTFDWDAANIQHLARHGVKPKEAEQAVLIDPLVAGVQSHETEDRILCFGRTASGRLLTVLYTERRGRIRVVTAYPMSRPQQKLYFQGE